MNTDNSPTRPLASGLAPEIAGDTAPKSMRDIAFRLEDVLAECFSESLQLDMRKHIDKALDSAADNFEYHFKQDFSYNMSAWCYSMAEYAIAAILHGDEDAMRKHLRCESNGYTGRDGRHSVIHGKLFETGAIELRKQIVNAFPELLKNERILDLEDQLASVVKELNRVNARCEELSRNQFRNDD